MPDALRSTLVAVMTPPQPVGRARLALIRSTWGRELDRRGIPWVMVVGDGDGQLKRTRCWPCRCLTICRCRRRSAAWRLIDWVLTRTDAAQLLKLNDDCHLAVAAWFDTAAAADPASPGPPPPGRAAPSSGWR